MTKFVRLEQLTLPALSFKECTQLFVRSVGTMHTSKIDAESDGGRKPATTMRVINLETGELARLICPALLVTALEADATHYVNKCYEINVSKDKLPGKNYKDVTVYRIECPKDEGKKDRAVSADEDDGS